MSLLFSMFFPFSLAIALTRVKNFLSRKGVTMLMLITVSSIVISSELHPVLAVNPNQELQLVFEPSNASAFPASDIFVVNGRENAHITDLIRLMGKDSVFFYKSNVDRGDSGVDGLIASDDVVLIKINEQWPYRGGTNTDVLKELIQAVIDHPDGFTGEIIVADNGQGRGSMDWILCNSEDRVQSTQDVVDMFSSTYNVSTYDWQSIMTMQVNEYSEGDMDDGYILYSEADPETGLYVSYPKFRTEFGTYVSLKYGVWNGTSYEQRLKVINMPVLKSHQIYGVTASLKHYVGVQSEEVQGGLGNGHICVATGGMGTLMVETGLPTLNIVDAIWVNANPYPSHMCGPASTYMWATRVNILAASVDPVALDYWTAKHILVPVAQIIGYEDTRLLDPDNVDRGGLYEAFGVWLNYSKNEIAAAGYNVTNNESNMNLYVSQDENDPVITLISPDNRTYSTQDLPLTFTVNEPASWIGYSLDGQLNQTTSENTTLTSLQEGSHTLIVYANDTFSNMGTSDRTFFTIDSTPPEILGVSQQPLVGEVSPVDSVRVNATVTDEVSGTNKVMLFYAFSNSSGTWIRSVSMTLREGNIWNATIPKLAYGTNVTYLILAEDNAGNTLSTSEIGQEYKYTVVPEFPSILTVFTFISLAFFTVLMKKKTWKKNFTK